VPDKTKTAIVTGANRGIGLALVEELLRRDFDAVIATFRALERASELRVLADREPRVTALCLDVRSDHSVAEFAASCAGPVGEGLDVLVNNAGIPASKGSILEAPISELENHTQTHAIGMIRVTRALLPLLMPGAVVANISSTLGTIGSIGSHYTHYAPAKTFQNALTLQLAAVLRARKVAVIAIHPGWVATEIGGAGASLSPTASAKGIVSVVLSGSLADTGCFFDHTGSTLPW
jgi:NAD(P)-dependent dehydrogenase (short-subunit alcohol dehydrogenase family)